MVKDIFGDAGWIVPEKFCTLEPMDIFHKEQVQENILPAEELKNTHMVFRGSFSLSQPARKMTLRITADDYYKLYINGRFVGQGPAQGYYFCYYWNEYDVSDYLVQGENVITVHTYYQGLINRAYNSGDNRLGMIAAVFDGEDYVFGTDKSWENTVLSCYEITHTIGYDTIFAENVDLRKWSEPAGQSVEKEVDYTFAREPVKALQVYEKQPASATEIPGGVLYDFGREITGGLALQMVGPAGSRVRILCGEELEDSEIQVRYDMRCNALCEEYVILAEGKNEYVQYEYKGFRYAAVLPEDGASVTSVKAVVRHYPFDDGYCNLRTDSDILQAIWKLCKNSVKYGCQEVYVDCPTREKGQYSGDMVITSEAQILLTGDTSLLKKAIDDQMSSARICKGLMAVTPGSLMQEIADYSLLFPILALRYYAYSGDKAYLQKNLEVCEGVLEHFGQYARADGLLEDVTDKWNLVDWPDNLRDDYDFPLTRPMEKGTGAHNVLNAFYVGFVMNTEKIRDILQVPYTPKSDSLADAFNREFYNAETGLYTDSAKTKHSALHSNVIPLYYGISKEKDEDKIAGYLMEKKFCCGVYMAYFMLKGLCRMGRYQDALALITSTEENSWYNMVREGATTCYEAWGKDKKWNTSLCHPWACAPISVLTTDILPHMPQVGEIAYKDN